MTVQDLIDTLSEMDPGAAVRLAFQPAWPFEHRVDAVEEVGDVVYIAEGGQVGYLATDAREALGWTG